MLLTTLCYCYLINVDITGCYTRLSLPTEDNFSRSIGSDSSSHADVNVLFICFHRIYKEVPQCRRQNSQNRIVWIPFLDLPRLQIECAVSCWANYTPILTQNKKELEKHQLSFSQARLLNKFAQLDFWFHATHQNSSSYKALLAGMAQIDISIQYNAQCVYRKPNNSKNRSKAQLRISMKIIFSAYY